MTYAEAGSPDATNTSQRNAAETMYERPPSWQDNAACRGAPDPSIFYPSRGGQLVEALAYCNACPVTVECLLAGFAEGDWFSVRGGMSVRQRRVWARGRRHALRCEECRIDFIGRRGQATCSPDCAKAAVVRRQAERRRRA